jgi:hypothetical protein
MLLDALLCTYHRGKGAGFEWLRIILRTREKTADLQKQIDENNNFLCEKDSSQNVYFDL